MVCKENPSKKLVKASEKYSFNFMKYEVLNTIKRDKCTKDKDSEKNVLKCKKSYYKW